MYSIYRRPPLRRTFKDTLHAPIWSRARDGSPDRPLAPASRPRAVGPAPSPRGAGFELTVDSIMRGPDLVGWPPTALRWSADSRQLYFDWRKPGEKEVLDLRRRPRRRRAPQADRRRGEERAAGQRPLGQGAPPRALRRRRRHRDPRRQRRDARRHVTRTTGAESNPRWARNDTHVTYVRDGNLFIVPVERQRRGARHAADRRRPRSAPSRG